MWARFDDRFHENRKIKRVWRRCPAAIGLHVMAITYSAGHLTDGFVDVDFVEDRMPAKRARDRAVAVLVDVGLWSPADEGWQIHDFAEFNETRADIEARRVAKSEAGKKGAAKRWGDGTEVTPAIAPATSTQDGRMAKNGSEPGTVSVTEPSKREASPPVDPAQIDQARQRQQEAQQVFDTWIAASERDAERTKFSADRKAVIGKALASHGLEDCVAAVQHIGRDAWARGANDRGRRFDDIKHALGTVERIERWRDAEAGEKPDAEFLAGIARASV